MIPQLNYLTHPEDIDIVKVIIKKLKVLKVTKTLKTFNVQQSLVIVES